MVKARQIKPFLRAVLLGYMEVGKHGESAVNRKFGKNKEHGN
jgi:hypothetical protein